MKCLASTQGPKIRVNAILPGLLLTEWVNETKLWSFCRTKISIGRKLLPRKDTSHERQGLFEAGGKSSFRASMESTTKAVRLFLKTVRTPLLQQQGIARSLAKTSRSVSSSCGN